MAIDEKKVRAAAQEAAQVFVSLESDLLSMSEGHQGCAQDMREKSNISEQLAQALPDHAEKFRTMGKAMQEWATFHEEQAARLVKMTADIQNGAKRIRDSVR